CRVGGNGRGLVIRASKDTGDIAPRGNGMVGIACLDIWVDDVHPRVWAARGNVVVVGRRQQLIVVLNVLENGQSDLLLVRGADRLPPLLPSLGEYRKE